MTSVTVQLTAAQPLVGDGNILKEAAGTNSGGWQDIVTKVSSYLTKPPAVGGSKSAGLEQLTGLLRLQMDVSQYQLRVEVVSKVAESAVASLRKLQQSQ